MISLWKSIWVECEIPLYEKMYIALVNNKIEPIITQDNDGYIKDKVFSKLLNIDIEVRIAESLMSDSQDCDSNKLKINIFII